MRMKSLAGAVLLLSATIINAAAQSDAYPSRSIRIVVPAASGGGIDPPARRLAEFLREHLGQPVIVDNKPGANGALAIGEVQRSAPDGYTLLMVNDAPLTVVPVLSKDAKYNAATDLTTVSVMAAGGCNVLVISADSPVKTLADFVALSKQQDITYATPSVGSPAHIGAEEFRRASGITMAQIHYKAAPPATLDVIAGRVTVFFANTVNAEGQIKAGRLRPLAVSTDKRCTSLPEVPTIAESGFPGFDTGKLWLGLFGPANLPVDVVARLSQALVAAKGAEPVRSGFLLTSTPFDPKGAAESKAFVVTDIQNMKARLKD